jgi:lactoylglutathione lyase
MDYELESGREPALRMDLAEKPTRLLHTMFRVHNLQKSLDFYIGALGMRLLRRQDYPAGRFTLAFVGYGEEEDSTVIELTHNWDQAEPYTRGTIYGICAELAEAGVPVTRAPGPMKYSSTLIAFVEDPDGYKIELINRK